jgi:general secretion pathway protein M
MDHQEQPMKAILANTWSEFWGERTAREKTLLTAGAGVLGLLVLYSILWAPAHEGRLHLLEELPTMQRQLAQMSAQANEARGLASNAQSVAPSGSALKDALSASLIQHGIAGAQVLSLGDAVQVQLKNAGFGAWVGWLDDVRKQYKVQIVETHAVALKEDGQVDLSATLQAPAVK